MEKSANQIATWKDLYSIGYRMPSSYRSSDKGVTYGELDRINAEGYYTLGSELFNSYYNGNTVTGLMVTPHTDVPVSSAYKETVENTYGTSVTHYNIIGTMGSGLVGVNNVYLATELITLYIYCEKVGSYMPSGSLYYRVSIRKNSTSGTVLAYSSWCNTPLRVCTGVKTPLVMCKSEQITVPDTYYIVVEWYTTMSSNYSYGARIGFRRDALNTYPCYSPDMCIPWNRINGSTPQSSSLLDPVTVPVKCRVEESVSGSVEEQTVLFLYEYKLEGSDTWESIITGSGQFYTSAGILSGSDELIRYVIINPYVSGDVVADRLSVRCGTVSSKCYWMWKTIYDDTIPDAWRVQTSNSPSTSIKIYFGDTNEKTYNTTLARLTGFYWKISPSK